MIALKGSENTTKSPSEFNSIFPPFTSTMDEDSPNPRNFVLVNCPDELVEDAAAEFTPTGIIVYPDEPAGPAFP
jgi:hypothetical protein